MKKKVLVLFVAFAVALLLAACSDKNSSLKADAEQQEKNNAVSQNDQQQSSQKQKGYRVVFDKFEKNPTVDYNFKEVELLTACLKGINTQVRSGQEFSHSATASADSWSMSLKMTGQYGETKYRDGMIPALKGQMEFSAESSDPRSFTTYKFSGPFVIPFETIRPDPNHESIRIGQSEVVGEREARIEYFEHGESTRKLTPPENFLFTVEASQ